MEILNEIRFIMPSLSVNEGAARAVVSSFLIQADPTVEELSDIRTAVRSVSLQRCWESRKTFPPGTGAAGLRKTEPIYWFPTASAPPSSRSDSSAPLRSIALISWNILKS